MLRRRIILFTLAGVLSGFDPRAALAHAGPRLSDPLEGATLGDTPTAVRLYFSERPEPSLSSIVVLDTLGVAYQADRAAPVAGDPLSLVVRVRPLPTGVYLVNWRTVSAVDGHVTSGAYAFGVRATPTIFTTGATPAASRFEIVARFVFIAGLVVLLGASSAAVAGVAADGGGLALGAGGWLAAAVGLILFAAAQHSSASASWADLMKTSVGRALLGRAVALGTAGVALLCVRPELPQRRRAVMLVVVLASMAAMAVHVANGHAAAGGRWPAAATVAMQFLHFAAAGVWVGGLAALLLRSQRTPSESVPAILRFSAIAGAGLLLVAVTGTLLTAGVLTSWKKAWAELISTGYGLTVLAKIALLAVIAAFGAVNRWRNVPAAQTDLRPLRRTGSIELTVMAGALFAASMLGALPPPAGGAPAGLDVSGTDFGTTVRVRLTTPSDQPGPNRFVVEAVDYDSKVPIRARSVSLRFTPLDDPGVAPTSLLLAPGADQTYVGSGANVSFDGRWRLTVLIEREKDSVEVPLDIEARRPPQRFSVERDPGQDPFYDVEISRSAGQMRIALHPERAGPSTLTVTWLDSIGDVRPLDEMVLTTGGARGPVRQQAVRRLGDRFVSDVQLEAGPNRIAVTGRSRDGARLRAAFTIEVPSR